MHFVTYPNFNGKRANETFVGNVVAINGIHPYLASRLTTIRLGSLALDINGEKLRPSEYLPMFVDNKEMSKYNRIMEDMLSEIRRA